MLKVASLTESLSAPVPLRASPKSSSSLTRAEFLPRLYAAGVRKPFFLFPNLLSESERRMTLAASLRLTRLSVSSRKSEELTTANHFVEASFQGILSVCIPPPGCVGLRP